MSTADRTTENDFEQENSNNTDYITR